MNNKAYWIWLQSALKYASNKVRTVNLIYGNAEYFYRAGESEWKMCGCFTNKEIDFMKSCKIDKAYKILDKCQKLEYDVITMSDIRYPERLKNIVNPPCVLYVKGNFPNIDNNICISVVGTRSATMYGKHMAFDISFELAKAGAVVISGGAVGVDESAHKGAIQGGGKTVAVLGCGIDYNYLMQNADLRDIISKKGALISEFPPGFPAYPSNFPIRNRIISGLSLGTVVVEAGARSGSLITAKLALEQNRDVFVVPVDMRSPVSGGSVGLIRDGARIATCGEDILCEYRPGYYKYNDFDIDMKYPDLFETLRDEDEKNWHENIDFFDESIEDFNNIDKKEEYMYNSEKSELNLSDVEQKVYDELKNGDKRIEEISYCTGLSIKELLPVLTNMEILDIIDSVSGEIYKLKKKKI